MSMSFTSIQDIRVSYSDRYYHSLQYVSLIDALKSIQNKIYEDYITDLRTTTDDELWAIKKRNLPFHIFSGTFLQRNDTSIEEYSSICVLDFDDLNIENISSLKEELFNNPYIFATWISASGEGLKALVMFDFSNMNLLHGMDYSQLHKEAYFQFRNTVTFSDGLQLDTTGSNISRMCYVSCDDDLRIKDIITPFKVEHISQKSLIQKRKVTIPTVNGMHLDESSVKDIQYPKNNKQRHIMRSICKYLAKRNKSITSSYQEWYKIGQAIANCFSYPIGKQYYLKLCRIDGINHDEEKSKQKIIECYAQSQTYQGHKVKMRTILLAAIKQGWGN